MVKKKTLKKILKNYGCLKRALGPPSNEELVIFAWGKDKNLTGSY